MGETYDFVSVGDVMLDIHVPVAPGASAVHAAVRVVAGGSAVNAARAAARLGARVAVVGRLGEDPAGAAVADALAQDGIGAYLATTSDLVTGTVVYVGEGVVAHRGANAGFVPDELPEARVTLVSGYLDTDAVRIALGLAHGLRAVDLQRPGQHAYDADVVLGTELAVAGLTGAHHVVCTTLGERGAIAVRTGERAEAAPLQTLAGSLPGAGDAFAAAFLLALADDRPLLECVERGNAAAASSL